MELSKKQIDELLVIAEFLERKIIVNPKAEHYDPKRGFSIRNYNDFPIEVMIHNVSPIRKAEVVQEEE